jgi:hypothetical protein
MTGNIRSVGHAGGTSTPPSWRREGPAREISGRQADEGVPLRATGDLRNLSRSAEICGFWVSSASSGMEWHDGPGASVRVYGRAR